MTTVPMPTTDTTEPTSAERSEAALLGAMIVSSEALAGACRMLAAGGHLFVRPAHRTLFELLEQMHLDDVPVDVVTTTDQLHLDGHLDEVGGPAAVVDLTTLEVCPTPAAWPTYATVVLREARRRRGIRVLREALARLEAGEDPAIVADELAVAV
jgi:replicative DNA helicase